MISFNNYLIALQIEQIGLVMLVTSLARSEQIMSPVDCDQAPSGFVEICLQFREFDTAARKSLAFAARQFQPVINAPGIPQHEQLSPAVPRQPSFVPTVYDCFDLQCLCPYFEGALSPNGKCLLRNGQVLQRAVRKEIRMLNDNERERFFNAIRQLKASGEYDRLAYIHRQEASRSGAHSGPSFLLWHREFTKRIEIALRQIDPSVALPYWDSSMDQHLPYPPGSIMWSPILMGETNQNGQVINGPFAGFTTLEGRPTITRNLGKEGHLLTDQNINAVYEKRTIDGILAYTAPTKACPYPPHFGALEYYHASVHNWIGGDMKPPMTSANDPVFFLHHSFVDYIFENWRQKNQNLVQREQDFPEEIISCTTPLHFANANMRPFNLVNKQGLSNAYTDYLYTYAGRPVCDNSQPTCHSQFLFCDLLNGPAHCVPKLRLGQRCDKFAGEDACYMGVCSEGHCKINMFTSIPPPSTSQSQQHHITSLPIIRRSQQHKSLPARQPTMNIPNSRREIRRQSHHNSITKASVVETCLNDDLCCSFWAKNGECHNNVPYMRMYCRRSCGYCTSTNMQSGCIDRHISCPHMKSQGDCFRRRQWMAENCRASCGWCNISPYDFCIRTALISRMK